VAPNAVADPSRVFLFAKGIDDRRIYLNTHDLVANSWSGWSEVPGGGVTDKPLASTAVPRANGLDVLLFAKGIDDSRVYVNTGHL
jgi:hypothetical protein